MNKIKKRKENSDTNIKKRVSLTGVQKKELCEKKRNNPNLKGVNLAKEYGISEQSVSDILKRSEHWLGLDDASTLIQVKRQRKPDNPELEEAMSIWVEQAIKNELTLTGHLLQAKAKEFANQFEITGFNASDGWLANFKKRNAISSY